MDKLTADHARDWDAMKAREKAETEAMWPTRGLMWVEKIEGYIKKASAAGHNYVWEPNTTNPNGSDILYIGEGDRAIYEKLMEYFRGQGYSVQEYQSWGMKITW